MSGRPEAGDLTNREAEPPRGCAICPRLVGFREANRAEEPGWFNGAVPSFGDPEARLLIVGLAPGLRGANRTGRPFTGDWAGELLFPTLIDAGFAHGAYGADPADGLRLRGCMITNAVRCVPPRNKPTGTEITACRRFLVARIAGLTRLARIVTLGKIAHDSTLRALGARPAHHPFGHGARREVAGLTVTASYHCSRYNTNTGRLTPEMFREIFAAERSALPPV